MRSAHSGGGGRNGGDAGFSLIEMMIATGLTLIVISAAFSALMATARLTDTARIMSDTNQGLEVGMSLMVRDFIQTGESVPRGGIPIPTGGTAAAITRPGPPGSALTFPTAWTTLPAVSPGGGLGPTVLGVATDIVTLIYADPTLQLNAWPLAAIAADGSSMTVDIRTVITAADAIKIGDLILFSNARGNAMQTVTGIAGQTVSFAAGDGFNLNQRGAPQGTIIQLQSAVNVYPPTTATRMIMSSYYLDVVTDPTLPRLVRQTNLLPALAFALGVENLQFSFDLIDGVTNPTNKQNVDDPNSPNQIRKANLFIAARSVDLQQQTHQYFRNSTATAVALRALSFVNRYQ